jgi:predicted component of type VI protein secretion system
MKNSLKQNYSQPILFSSMFFSSTICSDNLVNKSTFDSPVQYRNLILDNLRNLFNSNSIAAGACKIDNFFEYVKTSVLVYGVNSCFGLYAKESFIKNLKYEIKEAMVKFEPRIIVESLKVSNISKKNSAQIIEFNILCELKMPVKLEASNLNMKLAIDLETLYSSVSKN